MLSKAASTSLSRFPFLAGVAVPSGRWPEGGEQRTAGWAGLLAGTAGCDSVTPKEE